MEGQNTMTPPAPEEKGIGGAVGAIIVVALIVVGGFYLLNRDGGAPAEMTPEEIEESAAAEIEALATQGTSDEVADIEADLNTTDLESLGEELDSIDSELAI